MGWDDVNLEGALADLELTTGYSSGKRAGGRSHEMLSLSACHLLPRECHAAQVEC